MKLKASDTGAWGPQQLTHSPHLRVCGGRGCHGGRVPDRIRVIFLIRESSLRDNRLNKKWGL